MSLDPLVPALDLLAAAVAGAALLPLRAGACRPGGGRGRAWRALLLAVPCCVALLVAAAAANVGRGADLGDLAGAGVHLLGSALLLWLARLSRRLARDGERVAALEAAAFLDPLTGLGNRRRFDERFAEAVRHAAAAGLPLSLVMLDVDHFKGVNDAHGHGIGDLVLRRLAGIVAARAAAADTACRVGGEEFAVIVPGQEPGLVAAAAERLRGAVAAEGVPLPGGGELRATVSLGLAALRPGEDAGDLLRRADGALYAAKRAGRDRVSLAA